MTQPENDWLNDPTIPAAIRAALRSGTPLERIALDSEGNFWHDGELLNDTRISALFHRSIQRTPGGSYLLVVPPFSYPLVVADVPYWVTGIRFAPGQRADEPTRIRLRISDGSEEDLAFDTLRYEPRRGFLCRVKERTMPARFSRPCYFALAEYVSEEDDEDDFDPRGSDIDADSEARAGHSIPGRLSLVLGDRRYPIPLV